MSLASFVSRFIIAFIGFAGGTGEQPSIRIKGSDTMLRLNESLAQAYALKTKRIISVTGGGTSIGIDALFLGRADICAASRKLTSAELKAAASKGFGLVEVPIALDGLAIAVQASNPVRQLSLSQLRDIFTGKITNWREVGGGNTPIVPFARDMKSGTHAFFQEEVLRGRAWGKTVRFLPSTTEEVRELLRQKSGITFGGVAYFSSRSGVRVLAISAGPGKPFTPPSDLMVRERRYPIWRFLYFTVKSGQNEGNRDFIRWARSPEGQSVVQASGFYRIDRP